MIRLTTPSQAEFATALLKPAGPVPMTLHAWNGSDISARFAVYRNNIVVSLVQALAEGFPVVHRLVGDEFFRAMVGIYVRAHPPRSPVLAEYGDGFADWLATFEPSATLPYLADLARLEYARVRAYHAADTPTLAAKALGRCLQASTRLDRVHIGIHPSVTAITADWAAASLWAAHQQAGDEAIARVLLDHAESALVLRAGADVLVLPVARADAVFVATLQSAQPLAFAVEAATLATGTGGPFNLASPLSLLIRHGGITAWHQPGDSE